MRTAGAEGGDPDALNVWNLDFIVESQDLHGATLAIRDWAERAAYDRLFGDSGKPTGRVLEFQVQMRGNPAIAQAGGPVVEEIVMAACELVRVANGKNWMGESYRHHHPALAVAWDRLVDAVKEDGDGQSVRDE